MYKSYTYIQGVTQVTNLRVVLLKVEPISMLIQGISLKINQMVSTLLNISLKMNGLNHMDLNLPTPRGYFS
jgi:hypothetical protein